MKTTSMTADRPTDFGKIVFLSSESQAIRISPADPRVVRRLPTHFLYRLGGPGSRELAMPLDCLSDEPVGQLANAGSHE